MKKIAFISSHEHHINRNLYKKLQQYFPEYKVDFIDVVTEIKNRKYIIIVNTFMVFLTYGLELLLGRKKITECYFRTKYFFNKVRTIITKKINSGNYTFSIQSNSLYDTSTGNIPHFIYTDHTHLENLRYPDYNKTHLFSKSWLDREKSIYHNASMNFTYSTNIERSIIVDYKCPPQKVKCIYAGSNVPHDKKPELNNENYQNKNIIFVGVYWERKGGPDLVKAFEKVLKVHPDAKLTIVGCSPSVDVPNCNVVGKVKVETLDKYYLNSSIFCLPTKREPFGIVFIEAMMHKLPIVSNRIGALPDFVTEDQNGFLVEPGNVVQLADALIRLLDDPQMCKRFGETGYEKVRDTYTWDRVGQRLNENITPFLD